MEDVYEKAISAMRTGGQRFCDEAIEMWLNGQYASMPQKQNLEMVDLWKNVKDKIGEICNGDNILIKN